MVEKALDSLLHRKLDEPKTICQAMRYSLFAGGKRLRPVLVMAAAECCGKSARHVLKAAAALEMIHTYSLIHDDLPAMDDDDLRRGRPTNHKVFGEAVAILAGDGLLTYAFEISAENARKLNLSGQDSASLMAAIAQASGTRGMVGGQVADLQAEGKSTSRGNRAEKLLEYIHLHKTAALIAASLEVGAILSRATQQQRKCLRAYGLAVGLAFQIADDILDVVGNRKKLGKNGSDLDNKKLTYASLYGLEMARKKAAALVEEAHGHLARFKGDAHVLHALADYIIARDK
jgi:geranylgeranyl diphosphate synthase type II